MCTVLAKNCLQNMTAKTLRCACFFFKKIQFLGFHGVVLVKTFSLMYQLATNVELIVTKLKVISALRQTIKIQVKIQLSFFFKKIKCLGFHTCEDLSIDVSITDVGLILTKLELFLFWGDRQTLFQNRHMETCRHTKNFRSKLQL